MMTPTILPTEWHRRPKGFTGGCPVCGFPRQTGEHRATAPEENLAAKWLLRKQSPKGWQLTPVFATPSEPEYEPEQKPAPKIATCPTVAKTKRLTRRVRRRINQATRMIAQGETAEKIAKTLDVTPRAIEQWRQRHPKFWKRRFDHHIKAVVAKTRENAGTDRVLANPDEYLRLATLADKWTVENREQLFPTSDVDLSLSGFYRTYYLPNCLSDTVEETRRQYDIALNLWRRITGDPPLRFIINTTLAKFRDTLLAMKGRGGRPYSPNTVRSKLVQIQAILDAAGPSGPRKRDAAGLIAAVPYCKPPREEQQIPRAIALDRLADVYESARMMDCPEGLDFPPVLWWRSLLSVALNTALRRNNLFSLRWEYVYLEKHQVVIPAERMRKGRRPHLVPLNADAVAHLRSIRGDATADFVFPWPYTAKSFDDKFKLLQGLAGIPPGDRFGLQAIRRTAASLLWQQCPEAAQIVLGHRSSLITLRHYVQPQVAAAGALDRLTQPWTSRPGPDDGAKLPLPEPVITAATFLGGSTP